MAEAISPIVPVIPDQLRAVRDGLVDFLPDESESQLSDAVESAADATLRYGDWLRDHLEETGSETAVGDEAYAFFLKKVALMPFGAYELVSMARRVWERSVAFESFERQRDSRPILVHEGVPGHYFQLALSWAHEDPIRRHYYDSGANEGIGFYAEEMMLQVGFFDDSPKTREIIYNYMRLRALRVDSRTGHQLSDRKVTDYPIPE